MSDGEEHEERPHEEDDEDEEEDGEREDEMESIISGTSRAVEDKIEGLRELLESLDETKSCKICYGPIDNPCALRCGHIFCETCVQRWIDTQIAKKVENAPTCPSCREHFSASQLIPLYTDIKLDDIDTVMTTLDNVIDRLRKYKQQHQVTKQKLLETAEDKRRIQAELETANEKCKEEEQKNAQKLKELREKEEKYDQLEKKRLALKACAKEPKPEDSTDEQTVEIENGEDSEESCNYNSLNNSSVSPPQQKQQPNSLLNIGNSFRALFGQAESDPSRAKVVDKYTLGECATASPDEIIIHAKKLRNGDSFGLKYIECNPIFSPQARDDSNPIVYPKEAFISFVEPYILHELKCDTIIPLTGILSSSDSPSWQKWKSRIRAKDVGFFLELDYPLNDLRYHSAVGRATSGQEEHIALELFYALARLHCNGVVHRRVAPWNIRVVQSVFPPGPSCPIYLAGFGYACTPDGDESFIPPMLPPNSYSAPEMFSSNYHPNKMDTDFWKSCDVWAAACVVSEILAGTRGCPLFCPRILRTLASGQDNGAKRLMDSNPALFSRYPVLSCVHYSSERKGVFVINVEEFCSMVRGKDALNAKESALARLMSTILVSNESKRPSAEEVVKRILELSKGRDRKLSLDALRNSAFKPIQFLALSQFAHHNCPFFFSST